MTTKLTPIQEAIRTGGIRVAEDGLLDKLRARARRRAKPAHTKEEAGSDRLTCPRCSHTTERAKLTAGVEVEYCTSCRIALPITEVSVSPSV